MQVKIAGDWNWLWNAMDEGSRYQLAGIISKERRITDARKAFKRAKNNGRHNHPKYIVSDGLQAYKKAIRKEFIPYKTKIKHLHNAGISKEVNNNLMERLNGTVREREKVMRGFKVRIPPVY